MRKKQVNAGINTAGINRRTKLIRAGLALLVGLLVIPLFWVQIVQGPAYAQRGIQGRSISLELHEPRGSIYDRNGHVLAASTTRYDVIANPVEIANYEHWETKTDAEGKKTVELIGVGPSEAAKQMAPILKMDRAELGGLLTQNPHTKQEEEAARAKEAQISGIKPSERAYYKQYRVVAKDVTPQVMREIRNLKIRGISEVFKSERDYPRGATAANLVGFMSTDPNDNTKTKGAAGLELLKEDILKSQQGSEVVEIGANGVPIPGGYQKTVPAKRGTDIHLTLDADLTDYAQKLADETQKSSSSEWVLVAVEEVKTGRILAVGDSGVVVPKEATKDKPLLFGSRLVKDTYEPGSTGKLVTFATALEQGKITPQTPITSTEQWTAPNGQVINDSHEHGPEYLTAAGVLAQSSNTGTTQVGDRVTDEQRYQLMRRFGWGEKSGIDIPAEQSGLLPDYQKWGPRQRYTTMFGQGVSTTPLQVLDMVATIGNGGVRNKVHIIDGYTDPNGTFHKVELGKPQQVLSSQTAKTLVRMMEGVVTEEGTAPDAKINGYNIAAKTGTTQILSGKKGFVASFAGLVPAENPAVAILVVAYRPQTSIYGGVVAVPPFRKMAMRTMASLGVPPSTSGPELFELNAR
ncbi:peptidoglycan D,D-transpeptidase FtsI family protein [Boudabousia liubingyangii]|uniref:peptidoglycan D,D-transpeptidase FtsI family protein n=1 Tax=Boudabousia liubingyangii TaxID=1921764 RepID=UPI0009FB2079|nr:penicillin-binding protein 2 [Boudabousia liubingyangii]